jgi:Asp-tRNA(Asn)/Glu-tRNA(Gln) amidotransferase A subunit family amidase
MIGEVRAAPHGAVPLVVKDTFDVAGWPTTAGATPKEKRTKLYVVEKLKYK